MPGYYLHLAACNPEAKKSRSFILGVEAPDILKKYVKLYGIDGARDKYNSLKTGEMPNFEAFEERLLQKEAHGAGTGLHYGKSSKPDIMLYWTGLSDEEKNNPFYKGYLWHLLTDLVMYTRLDMEAKLAKFLKQHEGAENLAELRAGEISKLHMDWDKTNARVRDTYPDTILTPEVEELGVVQFIDSGELQYVDWNILKSTIDFLREFNPLNDDLDSVIQILTNVK